MGVSYTRIMQTYSGEIYDFSAKYDSYTISLGQKIDSLDKNLKTTYSYLNNLDVRFQDTSKELDDKITVERDTSYHYGYFFGFKWDNTSGSFAESTLANVSGMYSHAENESVVIGNYSHGEGKRTRVNGNCSHVEGQDTYAYGGSNMHAEGYHSYAMNNQAHAEGFYTTASGSNSHAEGKQTNAIGENSHAEGEGAISDGRGSHAEGLNTQANGIASHAEGNNTQALTDYSHTEGNNTQAGDVILGINKGAHAEGFATNNAIIWAKGSGSHAEGYAQYADGMIAANGMGSHAEGYAVNNSVIAEGIGSHAEGSDTLAKGNYSHVEGLSNVVYADMSHVEGYKNEAHGKYAHVDGSNNKAVGDNAHVSGTNSIAYTNAIALGTNIVASENEIVVGHYNKYSGTTSSYVFIVGIGDNSTNKNGLMVDNDGFTHIQNGIKSMHTSSADEYFASDGTIQSIPKSGHNYDVTHDSLTEGINIDKGNLNTASGIRSHAEGIGTTSLGEASHAEGYCVTANSAYAHAEGNGTIASGEASHAEGYGQTNGVAAHAEGNSVANNAYSHAEGQSLANAAYAHAEGYGTIASGEASHAEGYGQTNGTAAHAEGNSVANNTYSHAEGQSLANASYSHAEGESTLTIGAGSHAEGYKTKTEGDYSHAEGINTYAMLRGSHAEGVAWPHVEGHRRLLSSGEGSHAEGYETHALAQGSHAEGYQTTAIGIFSHTEGRETTAIDNQSHAEGFKAIAAGTTTHAEGSNTYAFGINSHAEGLYSYSLNNQAHAEGYNTYAMGTASHAEGSLTQAIGGSSHAEGNNTIVTGNCSHAEGNNNIVDGFASHAEGNNTRAMGNCSHVEGQGTYTSAGNDNAHAEGWYTYAIGGNSHTEGEYTYAIGIASHAEGYNNQAIGIASHAEGRCTVASGIDAHACGYYTVAHAEHQFVCGKFNAYQGLDNAAFIIGNGTATSTRKNAAYIMNDGFAYFNGISLIDESKRSGSKLFATDGSLYDIGSFSVTDGHKYSEKYDSLVEGINGEKGLLNEASGRRSHAEGIGTTASGQGAHTEGCSTSGGIKAISNGSHAEGFSEKNSYIIAGGSHNGNHAEGYAGNWGAINTIMAANAGSHAEGWAGEGDLLSMGMGSHAEGISTIASGNGSHAEGKNTFAFGISTHAHGYGESNVKPYKIEYIGDNKFKLTGFVLNDTFTSISNLVIVIKSAQGNVLETINTADKSEKYIIKSKTIDNFYKTIYSIDIVNRTVVNEQTKDVILKNYVINDYVFTSSEFKISWELPTSPEQIITTINLSFKPMAFVNDYLFNSETLYGGTIITVEHDDSNYNIVSIEANNSLKCVVIPPATSTIYDTIYILHDCTCAFGDYSTAAGYGVVAKKEYQTIIGKYNDITDSDDKAFVIGWGESNNRKNIMAVDTNGNIYENGTKLSDKYGSGGGGGADLTEIKTALTGFLSPSTTGGKNVKTYVDDTVAGLPVAMPVGSIIMWAGSAAPDGWLLCDGRKIIVASTTGNDYDFIYNDTKLYAVGIDGASIPQSELRNLAKIITYKYGIKNSEGPWGHILLPNFTGMFPVGVGTGNVKTGDTEMSFNLGEGGWNQKNNYQGEYYHKLTINEMPSHKHTIKYLSAFGEGPTGWGGETGTLNDSITSGEEGGGKAHNNVPPYTCVNFIIKYK